MKTLKYGTNTHIITPPSDSLPYDLYLTRPFESTKSAERLPYTGSLFRKPKGSVSPVKSRAVKEVEKKGSERSKGSSSSGLESDYETLRDGLAAEEAARGRFEASTNSGGAPDMLTIRRTQIVDKALAGKRGAIKGRGLSPNPASLPPSPALRGVGSPSGPIASASQQAMERSKYYRVPLVHELAVEDRTLDYLREKWDGNESEMLPALNKIADPQPDGKTWTMRRIYYKELDVYTYAYDTTEEREKAIKNAIKAYDKMRLSSREPEWERLNAPEDRGKGKCLSSLQAKIATKEPPPPAAPKIKVQKADDASSKDEGSTTDSGKTSKGGEGMARSSSNPLPTKAKKPSAADAQAKRLLSNNKPKPAASSTALKPSPTKGKGGKTGGGRILSQEIIEDSDVSDDETTAPAPKPKPAPAKPSAKELAPTRPRPVAREPAKPAPAKRQREDDDSSSSSGTPLAKRIKGRTGPLPLKPKTSQTLQRPAAPAPPPRAKDTSPTKSSPLASSPPTNVSDMDDATPPPQPIKKRHNEMDKSNALKQRKKARVITEEVITLASRFKIQYARYVKLHREIEASANPSQEDVEGLTRMRNRLATMKEKIKEAV
jgi:RNA polymerase II elongation factor ELL